jgi:hypothetical protein
VRVRCVCHRAAMEGARSQGHAENISTFLQLNLGLKHALLSTTNATYQKLVVKESGCSRGCFRPVEGLD